MKIVLFSMAVAFTSITQATTTPASTWDKKEIQALQGKALHAVYCAKPLGFFTKEACTLNHKELSFKDFKLKTLEWVNASTIRVGDGQRSVEITRDSESAFTMNGKVIDLSKTTTSEIRKKITAALPKVAALSWFFNVAHAEDLENNVFVELNRAVYVLLAQTTDKEVCKASQRIVDLCNEGKNMPGTENVISSLQDYASKKDPLAQGHAAKKALSSLQNFTEILERTKDLISSAYHHAATYYCSVEDRGDRTRPQEAFHSCNSRLNRLLESLEEGTRQMRLHDKVKYTEREELAQKLIEARHLMPHSTNPTFTPEEQQLLQNDARGKGAN